MNEQRNLILAIVLSAMILFGFQWLYPKLSPQPVAPATIAQGNTAQNAGDNRPPAPGGATPAPANAVESRAAALEQTRRVPIHTKSVQGSLALTGARLDDLTLVGYHEEPNPNSPEITLLSPANAPNPYFAEFGWFSTEAGVKVPGPETIWTPANPKAELTDDHPVVLSWDNGEGLRFVRTVAVDDRFMFTVAQRVENYGAKPVALYPYSFISRTGKPAGVAGTYILHEGPLGVLDGSLKEEKYDDAKKLDFSRSRGAREKCEKTTGGWIGITDKYWLTALVPDQAASETGCFVYDERADRYQVDFTGVDPTVVPAGGSGESSFHMFAGAKILDLLDSYSQKLGIAKFDLAIDFGWFWFLTKPFFYMLRMMHEAFGNMGLAIIGMTVLIKLVMFPLANKSYVSMSKMKSVQPEMQRLQQRYGDDKVRLQQEMMALYKREKVNPASGCLPMLVQIPVFFALYKVLFVTIEMRHAPFIGWIHDLSAPDPTTVFNLFGLLPFTPPHFMMIGIWPLIMGFTMWLQQKLNPQPADPVQAKMFQFLPIVFTFLLGQFAAGLVIYWAWSNTLSILQQWVIMKKAAVKG
jgi:YidC/Oxa1 family membrane protein insertase